MWKKLKISKTTKIVVLAGLTLLCVDIYIVSKVRQPKMVEVRDLKSFDQSELAKYDGTDTTLPTYLALNGYVYDVTAGNTDFYGPGQPYHDLVGKDSTTLLNMFGGEIIKNKYKVVGVYKP